MVSLELGLPSPIEERDHVKTMAKPKSRAVVLSIPRRDCTKVSAKSDVWRSQEGDRWLAQRSVYAVWGGSGGRSRDARSCAYVYRAAAEV